MGLVTLKDRIEAMPIERQQRIKNKAKQLCQAIELTKLRRAAKLSQTDIADAMNTSQSCISKIEGGADIQISTLCSYIQALGGEVGINDGCTYESIYSDEEICEFLDIYPDDIYGEEDATAELEDTHSSADSPWYPWYPC